MSVPAGAKQYARLEHKHSNKEGTRRNVNFVNITYKLMLLYNTKKLQKYTVLEYVF